jgi:glycosyltransferase involved in cell wall biosynthesis
LSSPATSHSPPATAPQALKGLVVGRLQNWKGAEVLCKALRLAPEIEIEWAGVDTDWGSTGLKASEYLAANYPDVFGKKLHWIGRLERDQVAHKMKVAGFLVVPSVWDVFNLTLAEGMEAGLPVICSRAAGAEMLIEHGHSGFLFDPEKPEELAAYLKLVTGMSEAERLKMGLNSQDAVKIHLDEGRILNLLEGSYGDAIKRGVTTSKEAWLASLLSAGPEQLAPPKLNLAQRAIRKAGRMLVDV